MNGQSRINRDPLIGKDNQDMMLKRGRLRNLPIETASFFYGAGPIYTYLCPPNNKLC